MSAGIPIVPIVIRNAEVISSRDSTTFNPGTVDVVVYPPISVEDWTTQNLPEKIEEVRQLYLDTLKSWPHESIPKIGPYARKRTTAQKAPAKKAAKKAAPKKAPAKKSSSKATAKKVPVKKAAAKKAPAKKGRS
jgi:putative phosphoserine phosphatase/1-acylglycerol-3-phosphate O-acyltransferase